MAKNVLGTDLQPCCTNPMTGFYRDGFCHTSGEDVGLHLVCARMTADFLAFQRERGNDLVTPMPEWGFPGLKPGDCWCVCVERWKEALAAGKAPPVNLQATHLWALEHVTLRELQAHADSAT